MPFRSDEDLFEQSKMSFGEHLEELRSTLWKCVLAIAIGSIVGFWQGANVVRYIQTPLEAALDEIRVEKAEEQTGQPAHRADGRTFIPLHVFEKVDGVMREKVLFMPLDQDPRTQVVGTGVTDPFMVYIKASLMLGVIVASPALFYFIWDFVASGLYSHERRYVYVFMPFSLGLFLAGAALAFFVAIELVLQFLLSYNESMGIAPMLRINEWLKFVLMLPLGFGVAFQLPLVMLFLERIGVFTVHDFVKSWKVAVLVIAILSMVLSPPDPGSMILLMVPLCGLYFGGIWLCRLLPRKTAPFGQPVD